MPYITSDDVLSYIGRSLPTASVDYIDTLILAAEDWLETELGVAFSDDPIEGEVHRIYSGQIRLRRRPVTSIQAVRVRYGFNDEVVITTANDEYMVGDLNRGLIYLAENLWRSYQTVSIDYTPVGTVPPLAKHIVAMLVGHFLEVHIDPSRLGVREYDVGRELRVDLTDRDKVPPEIREHVKTLRKRLQLGVVLR